jgi:hypothetical protein
MRLISNLSPQTLGMTDASSTLGVSLAAPGLLAMTLLFLFAFTRPGWGDCWNALLESIRKFGMGVRVRRLVELFLTDVQILFRITNLECTEGDYRYTN